MPRRNTAVRCGVDADHDFSSQARHVRPRRLPARPRRQRLRLDRRRDAVLRRARRLRRRRRQLRRHRRRLLGLGRRATRAASPRPSSATGWPRAATAPTSSSPPRSAQHPRYKGLSGATIKAAAEESLRRLGTDYIDLYYTHFDDPTVPVEEIVTALDELVTDGQGPRTSPPPTSRPSGSRSPWTSPTARASPATSRSSRTTTWSPATPTRARSQDIAARAGLAAVPYFALASGFLTGKYRAGHDGRQRAGRGRAAEHLETERGREVLAALDDDRRRRTAPRSPPSRWPGSPPSRPCRADRLRPHGRAAPALLAVADLPDRDWTLTRLA